MHFHAKKKETVIDGVTGRLVDYIDVEKLVKLHSKNGLNVAGEGGEFDYKN